MIDAGEGDQEADGRAAMRRSADPTMSRSPSTTRIGQCSVDSSSSVTGLRGRRERGERSRVVARRLGQSAEQPSLNVLRLFAALERRHNAAGSPDSKTLSPGRAGRSGRTAPARSQPDADSPPRPEPTPAMGPSAGRGGRPLIDVA